MDNENISQGNIFKRILDFLFPSHDEQLRGKLFVSGAGSLEFTIKRHPKDVFVYFEDGCYPIPCNPCDPGVDDFLNWYVVRYKHHHVLVIEWDVSRTREIVWKVC